MRVTRSSDTARGRGSSLRSLSAKERAPRWRTSWMIWARRSAGRRKSIDLHRQRELHQVQTYGLRGGLPVDCFYEGENMLVIHPDECIDCGVCEPECPVEAIKPDTEPGAEKWLKLNADYAKTWPNITVKKAPRLTLRSGRASRTNFNTSRRIPARVIEANRDVRFTPKSGHVQCTRPCLLWANSGHAAHELCE